MSTLVVGDFVVHPGFLGVAALTKLDDTYLTLKYSTKDVKKISVKHPMSAFIRKATEEEVVKARVAVRIAEYEHSALLRVWLEWLREAGTEGLVNDCGCQKNEFWNYTCSCRSSVKVYHRFSCFKDLLVNELGYKIEDVELDNGKHKTILHSEPGVVNAVTVQ